MWHLAGRLRIEVLRLSDLDPPLRVEGGTIEDWGTRISLSKTPLYYKIKKLPGSIVEGWTERNKGEKACQADQSVDFFFWVTLYRICRARTIWETCALWEPAFFTSFFPSLFTAYLWLDWLRLDDWWLAWVGLSWGNKLLVVKLRFSFSLPPPPKKARCFRCCPPPHTHTHTLLFLFQGFNRLFGILVW